MLVELCFIQHGTRLVTIYIHVCVCVCVCVTAGCSVTEERFVSRVEA